MTAILASIRDLNNQEVARVEARAEGQNLVLHIGGANDSCREMLHEIDDDKLCFMINGLIYLVKCEDGNKKYLPLDRLISQLSIQQLRLEYDSVGIERAFDLKRQAAKEQRSYVPFSALLDIVRQASHAR